MQAAEDHLLKAVAVSDSFTEAYFNLGLLYARHLHRPDDAIDALRKHITRGGARGIAARTLILKLQKGEEPAADAPEPQP